VLFTNNKEATMKLVLSLATALLLSLSAFATDNQAPIEISVSPGRVQPFADQYYSYNFGSTTRNFPLYTDFTLTNHGPGPLLIQRITISGIDFNATSNCPATLPPATYCTIRVRFHPWNEGFKTGRLLITTNEGRIIIDMSGWSNRF
jgi:hypothetical protein